MTTETQATDITALPPADRALIVLDSTKTEDHLNALVVEAAPITEVTSPAGRDQAHSLAMKMRKARTTIEKTGKSAREDAQSFSRAVIGEEKRLIGIIESEEKRVMGLRDGYDAKIEAEKAAKAAAEAARVSAIQEKITGIRNLPLALAGEPAEVIDAELQALAAFTPSEEAFQEFTEDCKAAIAECMLALVDLLIKVRAQEEAAAAAIEAKRIADEALAAERAAIQAEREAMARERAELAAARQKLIDSQMRALDQAEDKAITAQPVDTTTSVITVVQDVAGDTVPMLSVSFAEEENAALAHAESAPAATEFVASWGVRQLALATAEQFEALAGKVDACGVPSFADNLRLVAQSIRDGAFDAALAGANYETLVRFDNALLDATVNAIDALGASEDQAAA